MFVPVVTVVKPVKGFPQPPLVTDVEMLPLSWRVWVKREFWESSLYASKFVREVVSDGYRLPFLSPPPQTWRPNSKQCGVHEEFVDKAVQSLVEQECMVEVEERPWVVCGLSVDDSREELRLIFDARPVNEHLFLESFKYENINTARDILVPGGYLFQFDVKSAYPHIRVHHEHWGVLGVEWKGRFFVYTVLPFGLATAPLVFSKVMGVVVAECRARGVRVCRT